MALVRVGVPGHRGEHLRGDGLWVWMRLLMGLGLQLCPNPAPRAPGAEPEGNRAPGFGDSGCGVVTVSDAGRKRLPRKPPGGISVCCPALMLLLSLLLFCVQGFPQRGWRRRSI